MIIVSAEDRPDETIKPRLMAMGANLDRIKIVEAHYKIRKPGRETVVSPTSFQNRDYWRDTFRRVPDCNLFIVDPLPSYLGRGVNDSKNTEIRNVLEPFIQELIVPRDICMIGNAHLNKSPDAKTPMHRISGSIAYGNLPRNVHFVVRDPENPQRRFFKQAKCNNAPDGLPALAFKIDTQTVMSEAGEPIETAIPVFEADPVDIDLGAIVNPSKASSGKRGPKPERTTLVAEWLFDYLDEHGPIQLAKVIDAAGLEGFIGKRRDDNKWTGVSTLYNAKEAIDKGLPAPRSGFEVDEEEVLPSHGGRPRKHWGLREVNSEPE